MHDDEDGYNALDIDLGFTVPVVGVRVLADDDACTYAVAFTCGDDGDHTVLLPYLYMN